MLLGTFGTSSSIDPGLSNLMVFIRLSPGEAVGAGDGASLVFVGEIEFFLYRALT